MLLLLLDWAYAVLFIAFRIVVRGKASKALNRTKYTHKKEYGFCWNGKRKTNFHKWFINYFQIICLVVCIYEWVCVLLHLSVLCAVVIVRSASKYQNFGNYLLQSWCRRGCIVGFVLNNQTDATIQLSLSLAFIQTFASSHLYCILPPPFLAPSRSTKCQLFQRIEQNPWLFCGQKCVIAYSVGLVDNHLK